MPKGKKETEFENGDSGIIDEDGDAVLDEAEELEDEVPGLNANLGERILWVRDRVRIVGKDSDVGGKYKAVSHDKITGYIRPLLVRAGVFHWVSCVEAGDFETGLVTDKGRKILQHRATFEVTFENIHCASDTRVLRVVAHADDYGDKAPGKALSYATKYALLKIAMIETGEEDEDREAEKKYVRGAVIADDENMLADIWALADELFGDDAQRTLKAMSARRFFVDSYGEIPQDRYDDACRALRVSKKQLQESRARAGSKENDDDAK